MLPDGRRPAHHEEGVAQDTPPEALETTPTTREAMVAAIKQQVKAGTYRVDEIALAERLIEMPAVWEPRKPRKSRR